MTVTYTFDVFSSLDGYGAAGGNWTGYWGKQGPELLDHRLAVYTRSSGWSSGPPRIAVLELRADVTRMRARRTSTLIVWPAYAYRAMSANVARLLLAQLSGRRPDIARRPGRRHPSPSIVAVPAGTVAASEPSAARVRFAVRSSSAVTGSVSRVSCPGRRAGRRQAEDAHDPPHRCGACAMATRRYGGTR